MDDDFIKGKSPEYIALWLIYHGESEFKSLTDKYFKLKNNYPDDNQMIILLETLKEEGCLEIKEHKYFITEKGKEYMNKQYFDYLYKDENKKEYTPEEKKNIKLTFEETNNLINMAEKFWCIKPFFYNESKIFWMWDNIETRWKMTDEINIMNELDDIWKSNITYKNKFKSEMLESFRRVGRKHLPKDLPKTFIQFKDKFFDIKTKKIIPVTPEYFATNPIPYELGSNSSTPVIDKLFEEWVGKDYVITLHEIIAYCCLSSYPIHSLFAFVGVGRNGKSTFQNLLKRFIGKDNICSSELDLLINNRFESAKLYRKLVCLMGETNSNTLKNTSVLKKLCGQDMIGYEFKNKTPFDDENYAKIIINSNSLPPSEDISEGFYRRWMVISFDNKFPEGRDILNDIPDYEYTNLCKKITELLPVLLDRGSFTNQQSIDKRKEDYLIASNPLPLFINQFCFKSDDSEQNFGDFVKAYNSYLKRKFRCPVGVTKISKLLKIEGYETYRRNEENNKKTRYIIGFSINVPLIE